MSNPSSYSVNSSNLEPVESQGDRTQILGTSTSSAAKRTLKKLEKAPLLSHKRLFSSLSGRTTQDDASTAAQRNSANNINEMDNSRTLGLFGGVFAPVSLSQFSTLLFLRIGFVIGSVGLFLGLGSLLLAYGILLFTILSICAISTNGAVEGGGAYFMISRTLGPEFGGAIGALFFFANVFSSALYSTGCIEGILQSFGSETGMLGQFLPEGPWYSFGYTSALNGLNLLVCLIGAGMFAKTTLVILFTVLACTASVFISYLAIQHEIDVPIPATNIIHQNETAKYTGLSLATLKENLYPDYFIDYTTENQIDYATVFSVLFSGVTGIMAGANMSGELLHPGRSIPAGTLFANIFTFCLYILLFLLTAATSSRFLLQNNYVFMIGINLWAPFITIGIMTTTLSASLSNIIGASRVLAALVKDNIYGSFTRWIGLIHFGLNPIGAILVAFVLVECVLLIGELNTIARFTSVFFLLSYLATNIACLSLEWASAPNFRPTFQYFSWWTAVLGIIGNGVMMFVISAIASAVCIIICLILVIILHLKSPSDQHKWGSISQALIFHQVRKYLLMLDTRKAHVKFWRPQILLLVANPRSSCPLIDFVNDLKKSGLYIIGHVKVDKFDSDSADPAALDYPKWQMLVDHLKVKAFIEVTVCSSVREGMQQLTRVSGLGAMKPNTVVLGFCDDGKPQDFFNRDSSPFSLTTTTNSSPTRGGVAMGSISGKSWGPGDEVCALLQDWQKDGPQVHPVEYVCMIQDGLQMGKNVCLCRYFHLLDKEAILKKTSSQGKLFIDVWPVNFFNPDDTCVFDTSSLFLLQLATVLHMVSSWNKRTLLRVFLCVSDELQSQKIEAIQTLRELRIQATIQTVHWQHIATLCKPPVNASASTSSTASGSASEASLSYLSENYLMGANQLVRENSNCTAVTFMYLPEPPVDKGEFPHYLKSLTTLTQHLHPTVLVHGVSAVTTTNL